MHPRFVVVDPGLGVAGMYLVLYAHLASGSPGLGEVFHPSF